MQISDQAPKMPLTDEATGVEARRRRLHQAAAILLYAGPLLAGLGGHGLAMLWPFVGMFMLWLVLLRPEVWAEALADWTGPAPALQLLTLLLSQILFVTLLFGLGRGIGGVMGSEPFFHGFVPLAVSFLSLPVLYLLGPDDLRPGPSGEQNPPAAERSTGPLSLSGLIALSPLQLPAQAIALLWQGKAPKGEAGAGADAESGRAEAEANPPAAEGPQG